MTNIGVGSFCPLDPARADAAWPDAEVVLAAHGPMFASGYPSRERFIGDEPIVLRQPEQKVHAVRLAPSHQLSL